MSDKSKKFNAWADYAREIVLRPEFSNDAIFGGYSSTAQDAHQASNALTLEKFQEAVDKMPKINKEWIGLQIVITDLDLDELPELAENAIRIYLPFTGLEPFNYIVMHETIFNKIKSQVIQQDQDPKNWNISMMHEYSHISGIPVIKDNVKARMVIHAWRVLNETKQK